MKRILSALFSLIFCCAMYAQTEHMKFMGIPLTGTITAFQSKLQAKGVSYDALISKNIPAGCRAFRGTFSGEDAEIYVYYNERTKVVYRAKAVIECINEDRGRDKLNTFKSMLTSKYVYGDKIDDEQNGHPSFSIRVYDSSLENVLGIVGLYISNHAASFRDEVYLHVDYEDALNGIKNIEKNMDDL